MGSVKTEFPSIVTEGLMFNVTTREGLLNLVAIDIFDNCCMAIDEDGQKYRIEYATIDDRLSILYRNGKPCFSKKNIFTGKYTFKPRKG